MFHSGKMWMGADQLTAVNQNAEIIAEDTRVPVRNLEGTWPASLGNDAVVTNGASPFEYHITVPVINPTDVLIQGHWQVDSGLAEGAEGDAREVSEPIRPRVRR